MEYTAHLATILEDRHQRVTDMAKQATQKAGGLRNDQLKEAAVLLHKSTRWAQEHHNALRTTTRDLIDLVNTPGRVQNEIWPGIARLRAWWMDTVPLFAPWRTVMGKKEGLPPSGT